MQEKILAKAAAYRFVVLILGRRTGKTVLIEYIITGCIEGKIIYLFAPEFAAVAQIWDKVKENLSPAFAKIDNTNRIINFHGGGIFRVIGLHSKGQQDKGRGAAIDVAIYEETQSIDSDILAYHWLNVIRPTLADRKGTAWFVGTPPNSKSHYFAKLYCKGVLNNPNANGADVPMSEHIDTKAAISKSYISFRKTAHDNPYIDNLELAEIERENPPLVFQQEFMAQFVEYSNRPFILSFDDAQCEARVFSRLPTPNLTLPFYISFDFNLGAMAATIWQTDRNYNVITCLAEFGCGRNEKVSIHYTTDLIRAWFKDNLNIYIGNWGGSPIAPPPQLQIFITGDATGTQGDPRARSGRTFYQTIISELGLENRPNTLAHLPKANPHHSNTWLQLNTWLSNHKQIFISPKCTRLRQDLKLTQIGVDKGIDKKAYDPHWFDTMRYFFNSFIPSKHSGQGK
jgi:hypothetical protein